MFNENVYPFEISPYVTYFPSVPFIDYVTNDNEESSKFGQNDQGSPSVTRNDLLTDHFPPPSSVTLFLT